MPHESDYIAADIAMLDIDQIRVLLALTDRYQSFSEIREKTGISEGSIAAIIH